MSLLTTITSSLPNVLNLLQGSWEIQYKTNESQDSGMMQKAKNLIMDVQAWLNSKESENDGATWESLPFDSFIDLQEILDSSITDSPVENGSFRSVNKVRKPRIVKATVSVGGIGYSLEDVMQLVKKLQPLAMYNQEKIETTGLNGLVDDVTSALKDFGTSAWNAIAPDVMKIEDTSPKPKPLPMEFRIITPFDMIKNLNLIKVDYTFKKETGRNILILYLTFQEVINVKKNVYLTTNVKNPQDADKESTGQNAVKKA